MPKQYSQLYNKIVILLISICLCLSACSDNAEWQSPHPRANNEKWVAHAGGMVNHMNHANCLEGLNASAAAGMHLIELDFEMTQDGHLVLLHDWDKTVNKLFAQTPGKRTLAQFKALKTAHSVTPVTAQELFAWLDKHPKIVVIADIKTNEIKSLKWIQSHYPDYAERIIPEITKFRHYRPARELGFYRVILDLWQTKYKDSEILNFCKTHPVWAVAMTDEHVLKGTLTNDLKAVNIPVYAFTVNDSDQSKNLFKAGVFGIYSDMYSLK